MAETMHEMTPQVGDHVELVGTSITGDVQRIGSSSDHSPVTFKVDPVRARSRPSKTARALRGAWITCPPELLTLTTRDEQGIGLGAPTLDAALRAHVERLVAEFAPRFSRKQIQQTVEGVSDALRGRAHYHVRSDPRLPGHPISPGKRFSPGERPRRVAVAPRTPGPVPPTAGGQTHHIGRARPRLPVTLSDRPHARPVLSHGEIVSGRRNAPRGEGGREHGRRAAITRLLSPVCQSVVDRGAVEASQPDRFAWQLDDREIGRVTRTDAVHKPQTDRAIQLTLGPGRLQLRTRNLRVPLLRVTTAAALADQDTRERARPSSMNASHRTPSVG